MEVYGRNVSSCVGGLSDVPAEVYKSSVFSELEASRNTVCSLVGECLNKSVQYTSLTGLSAQLKKAQGWNSGARVCFRIKDGNIIFGARQRLKVFLGISSVKKPQDLLASRLNELGVGVAGVFSGKKVNAVKLSELIDTRCTNILREKIALNNKVCAVRAEFSEYLRVAEKGPEGRAEISRRLDSIRKNLAPTSPFDGRYLQGKAAYGGEQRVINRSCGDLADMCSAVLARTENVVARDLNVSRIALGSGHAVIAGQYPLPYQVQSHLKMMMREGASVVAVLSSMAEMDAQNLPDYFSCSAEYGDVKVESTLLCRVQLDSHAPLTSCYQLDLVDSSGSCAPRTLSVLHVDGWVEGEAIDVRALEELARTFDGICKDSAGLSREDGLGEPQSPVVHATAGAGRTGVMVCMLKMLNTSPTVPLEQLIAEICNERNGEMVRTRQQLDALIDFALKQGRPILSRELWQE